MLSGGVIHCKALGTYPCSRCKLGFRKRRADGLPERHLHQPRQQLRHVGLCHGRRRRGDQRREAHEHGRWRGQPLPLTKLKSFAKRLCTMDSRKGRVRNKT